MTRAIYVIFTLGYLLRSIVEGYHTPMPVYVGIQHVILFTLYVAILYVYKQCVIIITPLREHITLLHIMSLLRLFVTAHTYIMLYTSPFHRRRLLRSRHATINTTNALRLMAPFNFQVAAITHG